MARSEGRAGVPYPSTPLGEQSRWLSGAEALSVVFFIIFSFLITPKKKQKRVLPRSFAYLGVWSRSDIWVLVSCKIFTKEQASIGKPQPIGRTGNEAMSLFFGSKLPASLMGRFGRKPVRALLYCWVL